MAFWSSAKLSLKQREFELIRPFDEKRIQQASYELSMGSQASISCDTPHQVTNLDGRDLCVIPRGQFGLLITLEEVQIPTDTIAFISLKTKIKSRGLVNVSGFHVDPGFRGKLKFWVYNAGNQDIQLQRGDPVFLIWFANLDQPETKPYEPNGWKSEITADDLQRLQGHLASPAALSKQLGEVQHEVQHMRWELKTLWVALVVAVLVKALVEIKGCSTAPPPATTSGAEKARAVSTGNAAKTNAIVPPSTVTVTLPAKDTAKQGSDIAPDPTDADAARRNAERPAVSSPKD